jgi:hypothetical protein
LDTKARSKWRYPQVSGLFATNKNNFDSIKRDSLVLSADGNTIVHGKNASHFYVVLRFPCFLLINGAVKKRKVEGADFSQIKSSFRWICEQPLEPVILLRRYILTEFNMHPQIGPGKIKILLSDLSQRLHAPWNSWLLSNKKVKLSRKLLW